MPNGWVVEPVGREWKAHKKKGEQSGNRFRPAHSQPPRRVVLFTRPLAPSRFLRPANQLRRAHHSKEWESGRKFKTILTPQKTATFRFITLYNFFS
jgi:hypothetical protein